MPSLPVEATAALDDRSEDEDDDKGVAPRVPGESSGGIPCGALKTFPSDDATPAMESSFAVQIAALRAREECRKHRRAAESSESCLARIGWGGGSDCVRAIVSRLRHAGLQVKRVRSLDGQSVLIKVRAPEWRLEEEAERMRLPMRTKVSLYSRHLDRFLSSTEGSVVSHCYLH